MDVQRWLDETVLPPRPPSSSHQLSDHEGPSVERAERTSRKKHTRKQSTSDSSLLEDLPQRKKAALSERGSLIHEPPYESARADAPHRTSGSVSTVSSQPYRRKPRHKTRPERYEPVSKDAKERGTRSRRHRKDESNKTRRIKADKQGSGIVQTFHAKNVPRDRLTLKPQEKLGLFSKGRVSSPVKGRGLPDLVFSEMRFLQKNKDQPEADPPPESPRKRRKKDQAYAKEEDISAYFTSVRPALAERESNVQAKDGARHGKLGASHHSEHERSSVADNAIPTVEPVDKASHLVFGGGVPRHESGSYISWSESVRAPSATPVRPRVGSVIDSGQLDPIHGGKEAGNTDGGGALHSMPAPPTVTRRLTDESGGRFQVSSLPPANERLSRSHSLPQHASSPRLINLVDRAARRRTLESVASPSSMPPFLPNHGDHRRAQVQVSHVPAISGSRDQRPPVQLLDSTSVRDGRLGREAEEPELPVEDDNQQPSSGLGRILQECNTAFHKWRKTEPLQPDHSPQAYRIASVKGIMRPTTDRHPIVRRIPTVRFAGVEGVYDPKVPPQSGLSIYDQQARRQYDQADPTVNREDSPPMFDILQHEHFDDEEFGFDEQEWDEEAELAAYGVRVGPRAYDGVGARQGNENIIEGLQSQGNVVVKPGFWRPHKLY